MNKRRRHEPHAVYRLWSKDGRLLYVGCSLYLLQRMKEHSKTKAWGMDIARANFEWFPNQQSALEAERRAIAAERPEWNVHHRENPKRSRGIHDGALDRRNPTTWLRGSFSAGAA